MKRLFLGLAIVVTGCTESGAPDDPLAGGVVATFRVNSEEFRVWVTNPTTIRELRELEAGRSQANIPNGPILEGAGQADHNEPWSWHFDPEAIAMAELTVEVCDAEPSYVEAHRDEFVNDVGSYCPWAAMLIDLEDH